MADINHIISLGIGSPAAIKEFLTVGLQIGSPPADASRTFTVPAETRTHTPTAVSRTFTPTAVSRTHTLTAVSRTYTPPAISRTYTVPKEDDGR